MKEGDERWELWPRGTESEIKNSASGGIDGGDEQPWELSSQGEEMLESDREEV